MPELLIPDIWVDQESFDDPDAESIVLAAGDFLRWVMDECLLDRDQFPEEALWTYWVDYYLGQVLNGGHKQFAMNSGLSREAILNTERGLRAMNTEPYLRTFLEFKRLLSDAALAKDLIENHDFRDQPEAIRALDDYSINWDALRVRNAEWLRTGGRLKVVPISDLQVMKKTFSETRATNIAHAVEEAKIREKSMSAILNANIDSLRGVVICAPETTELFELRKNLLEAGVSRVPGYPKSEMETLLLLPGTENSVEYSEANRRLTISLTIRKRSELAQMIKKN